MSVTWSAVRVGRDGECPTRKGWCSHKHRSSTAAAICARRLNRAWGMTGEVWVPAVHGHLLSTLPVDPVTGEALA